MKPCYLEIEKDDFKEKISRLYEILKDCTLCPRRCRVIRTKEKGYCCSGRLVI